jgi:hypothetical protein
MVSKRWLESKWQDIEFVALPAPVSQRIPSSGIRMRRLSGEIVGPWLRGLASEAFKESPRAIGVSRALRQFQACAPRGRHRLLHAEYLKRRAPPPGRGRRSRLLRDRAPSHELVHGAFELHIRSLMHRFLPTKMIRAFAIAANAMG